MDRAGFLKRLAAGVTGIAALRSLPLRPDTPPEPDQPVDSVPVKYIRVVVNGAEHFWPVYD